MDQHRPAAAGATAPAAVEIEPVAAAGVAVAEIGDTLHAGMEYGQRREQDPCPGRLSCNRTAERLLDRSGRAQTAAHENRCAEERCDGKTERDPHLHSAEIALGEREQRG